MYEKILVPLDGSARAEAIMPHVEELAQKFNSTVVLTRVVSPLPILADPQDTLESELSALRVREQEARQYLSGRVGELRGKGIDAASYVMYGGVVEAILRLAELEEITLIAIASHGRGGLGNMLVGSVAAGLMHRAPYPMLVIRAREN
jgi:nucleotide-binding universal stress UspA family protein